jgi:hypothetical protein
LRAIKRHRQSVQNLAGFVRCERRVSCAWRTKIQRIDVDCHDANALRLKLGGSDAPSAKILMRSSDGMDDMRSVSLRRQSGKSGGRRKGVPGNEPTAGVNAGRQMCGLMGARRLP